MSAGRLMTNPSSPPPAREQILAAVEAGSAALRALEVAAALSREGEGNHPEGREHLDRAIDLLRQSIGEMRRTEHAEPRVGASGFVMAVRRHRRRAKPPTEPPQAA